MVKKRFNKTNQFIGLIDFLESLAYDFGYLSQSRLPLRWQIVI